MQRLASILMIALLLSACSTIEKEEKRMSMNNTTRFYEYALRWSDYDAANAMRNPESTIPSPDPATLKKFRVTSYTVVNSLISEDGLILTQIVDMRYYNEENLRERQLTEQQEWVYDAENEIWYLDGPLPAFQ
jgi:PBP1b-binding outer membrane lipoprotein LpoB